MGISKSELFSDRHNQMARMAKALAHPARIAILEYLMNKESCVCGDIVEELPLSQATVSQHLKAMKDAGIIRGSIDGPFRCYCIDQPCCQQLKESLVKMFANMRSCC
jgi:DNA-binding transcriptional ArsR family regulator